MTAMADRAHPLVLVFCGVGVLVILLLLGELAGWWGLGESMTFPDYQQRWK